MLIYMQKYTFIYIGTIAQAYYIKTEPQKLSFKSLLIKM